MISKFDADNDGLISQEEFKVGRPEGAPPDMMGMMGGMQSPLEMPNRSEAESSSSIDPLDRGQVGKQLSDPEIFEPNV